MLTDNSLRGGLSCGVDRLSFRDSSPTSLDPISTSDPPAAPKSADSFPIPPRGVRIRAVHRCLHVEISRLERLAVNSDYGVPHEPLVFSGIVFYVGVAFHIAQPCTCGTRIPPRPVATRTESRSVRQSSGRQGGRELSGRAQTADAFAREGVGPCSEIDRQNETPIQETDREEGGIGVDRCTVLVITFSKN